MDFTAASAALAAAALLGAGVPFVRRQRRVRAIQMEQLRYLESLLVEARSSTFPVTRCRVSV
jgi:hypothetical protein